MPATGAALLAKAHEAYKTGNYPDCVRLCMQVYEGERRNLGNLLLLGAAHFVQGQLDQCLRFNEEALAINPEFAEAYSNIANVYKERGEWASAIGCYNKAIALKPSFADAHGNLAGVYMNQGNNALALHHYSVAVTHNPTVSTWQVDLGHLLRLQGDIAAAQECFVNALNLQPDFPVAWSNLACTYKDQGHLELAVKAYMQAIDQDPAYVDAYCNCATVYKEMHDYPSALKFYLRATELRPDDPQLLSHVAVVQLESGFYAESIATYQQVLRLKPDLADAWSNMGNALKMLGQEEQSVAAYEKALVVNADHPDALNNLANAKKETGDFVTAEQLYRRAIRIRPKFAGAHSNLGNLLKDQHRLAEALEEYQTAIECNPNFADAYSNMGNALKDFGRASEAIACYQQAINLRPNFPNAYANMAAVHKDSGRLSEAITCYRKALSLRPLAEGQLPDPIAYCNLVHCLQTICDWTDRENVFKLAFQIVASQMKSSQLPAIQPHHALTYPFTAEQQRLLAQHYAVAARRVTASMGIPVYPYSAESIDAQFRGIAARRVRLGFISSDIGNHPLSHLMRSVFGMHDRRRFELFMYASSVSDGSAWRLKAEADIEHFKEVSLLSFRELADLVKRDHLDILVNLNGYTRGSRNEVFSLRPAPIQVMYMGFPGTSGADYMQYFVTDRVTSPPDLAHLFTEKLAYMPDCYFVNDHAQSYASCISDAGLTDDQVNEIRAQYGLPPRPTVVFCMFNQLYKIDPAIFDCWMKILARVPDSVLWLLQFPAAGQAHIAQHAADCGFPPSRLVFTPVATKAEHIRRGQAADLFLDTTLCNAHTTGTDILWGGTPMITCPGRTMASRVAASLLDCAGLGRLIANSLTEYEELAVRLGNSVPDLRALQAAVRKARVSSPLFNTKKWVDDWQLLLLAIIEDFRTGGSTTRVPVQLPTSAAAPAAAAAAPAGTASAPGAL